MVTVTAGMAIEFFIKKTRRTGPVQCQLLAAINHGLIVLIKMVITFTDLAHMEINTPDQPDAHDRRPQQPGHRDSEQPRRQPGQPPQGRHAKRGAVDQLRQMHKGDCQVTQVGAQRRQQVRPAHLFQLLDVRGQHTAHQVPTQAVHHPVPQHMQGHLGGRGRGQQRHQQQGKLEQHHRQVRATGQQPLTDKRQYRHTQYRTQHTEHGHRREGFLSTGK